MNKGYSPFLASKFSDAGYGDGHVQNHVEDGVKEECGGDFIDLAVGSSGACVGTRGPWVWAGFGVD